MKTILITIVMLFFSAVATAFDREPTEVILRNPEKTYVAVVAEGEGIGVTSELKRKPGYFKTEGAGLVVRRGVVITAAHIIEPEKIYVEQAFFVETCIKIRQTSVEVYIVNVLTGERVRADVDSINAKKDTAVLVFDPSKGGFEPEFEFEALAQTPSPFDDILRGGDAVAIVARKLDAEGDFTTEYEVRYGSVIDNHTSDGKIWLDLETCSGDSGSAIFAFLSRRPVIIGIVVECDSKAGQQDPEGKIYVARTEAVTLIVESL